MREDLPQFISNHIANVSTSGADRILWKGPTNISESHKKITYILTESAYSYKESFVELKYDSNSNPLLVFGSASSAKSANILTNFTLNETSTLLDNKQLKVIRHSSDIDTNFTVECRWVKEEDENITTTTNTGSITVSPFDWTLVNDIDTPTESYSVIKPNNPKTSYVVVVVSKTPHTELKLKYKQLLFLHLWDYDSSKSLLENYNSFGINMLDHSEIKSNTIKPNTRSWDFKNSLFSFYGDDRFMSIVTPQSNHHDVVVFGEIETIWNNTSIISNVDNSYKVFTMSSSFPETIKYTNTNLNNVATSVSSSINDSYFPTILQSNIINMQDAKRANVPYYISPYLIARSNSAPTDNIFVAHEDVYVALDIPYRSISSSVYMSYLPITKSFRDIMRTI